MIKRNVWFLLVIIGNIGVTPAAFEGNKWAIGYISATAIVFAILLQRTFRLLDRVLGNNDEILEHWERDLMYAAELGEDHQAALRELAEHDPVLASIYYDRMRQRVLERNPEAMLEIPVNMN